MVICAYMEVYHIMENQSEILYMSDKWQKSQSFT